MDDNNVPVAEFYSESPNTPSRLQSATELAQYADSIVSRVSCAIENISISATQLAQLNASVKLECQRMDHAFNELMLKAQKDLALYEMTIPVLDKNLDRCQNRMDDLMFKTMDMINGDLSEASLRKQELAMNMVETVNEQLMALISKLLK